MPKFNDNFELSVEDVELIEEALRREKNDLSHQALSSAKCEKAPQEEIEELDSSVRQIQDLLGRLHNQKIFYRPQQGAYIGG